jgi:hypothetical protein
MAAHEIPRKNAGYPFIPLWKGMENATIAAERKMRVSWGPTRGSLPRWSPRETIYTLWRIRPQYRKTLFQTPSRYKGNA